LQTLRGLDICNYFLNTSWLTPIFSVASVKVYLDYDDKSLSDVGKILEKDFDIGTKELLRTKVVAQFVRISDDLVHCVVTEPIHMYWQNEFSKEVKIILQKHLNAKV